MGCGASKGEEKKETVEEMNFKNTGVWEMDDFFR